MKDEGHDHWFPREDFEKLQKKADRIRKPTWAEKDELNV
jgi:hypothetical protein